MAPRSAADRAALKAANRRLAAVGAVLEDPDLVASPEWVQFETTHACNLECPHCGTHGTEERRREYNQERKGMDRGLFSEVAADALSSADEVTLSVSGEPLATPGLESILEEIEPYGARLNLVTNGTTLSAKRVSLLLPVAGHIKVSLDGATPAVLEATRKGARWAAVLHKVRVLTRAIELAADHIQRPRLQLSVVAMASNLRELPWLVRLAHVLDIRNVAVASVVIHFPHLADEALDRQPALYNACRAETLAVAEELGVHLVLPPEFPDVAPDPEASPEGEHLLIKDLAADYYEKVPPLESAFEMEEVDAEARRAVDLMLERRASREDRSEEDGLTAAGSEINRRFDQVLDLHGERLREREEHPEETVKYCLFLHRRAYVSATGKVTPCCTLGRPELGAVGDGTTLDDVWHGEAYAEFRRRFYSDDPFDCCKDCWFVKQIPRSRFLKRIRGEGTAGEV